MRIELGLSLIEIGTVLSVGLLATVLMQFVFGYLSDLGFTRRVLFGGLVSVAFADLLFFEAGNYVQVLLFYVLLRAVAGVYHPVSFSAVFKSFENRPRAMGIQSAVGDASIAFALFTTGFIAESLGWKIPFILWGVAGIGGVVAFVLLMSYHEKMSEIDSSKSIRNQEHNTRRYIVLQFGTGSLQCLYLTFTGFMPLFLNINLKLTPGLSAFTVALWMVFGVVAGFNAGKFVKFFGSERRTLKFSFLLTALLLAAATLTMFMPNLWNLMLVLLVLSGTPFFLAFPVLYGIVGAASPTSRLGLAYATNLSLSLLAGSLASYGVGYLSSIYTLAVVIPVLLAIAMVAVATVFLL
jgi:MFS family permease